MLKSMPLIETAMFLLGTPYWLERVEHWLMTNKYTKDVSGGVASTVGADVVGPATAQFPQSSSTVDTIVKLTKAGMEAWGNPNARWIGKQAVKDTFIFAQNWWDIIDSNIDKNGFVLRADGTPKYSITSDWDRSMLAMGLSPENKKLQMLTHNIVQKQKQQQEKNVQNATRAFVNVVQGLYGKGADPEAIATKALEVARQGSMEFHIKPEQYKEACKNMRMSPAVRDIVNNKILIKMDAYNLYKANEEKTPGSLFPR